MHIINRLPTRFLTQQSPYQILHGEHADLRVFGCLCFANTLTAKRKKLDARARKCIFLGYKYGIKGFVVHDIVTQETFISRNVEFYENIFPFNQNHKEPPIPNPNTMTRPIFQASQTQPEQPDIFPPPPDPEPEHDPPNHEPNPDPVPTPSPQTLQPDLRRSTRNKRPPSYLEDYHISLLTNTQPPLEHTTKYPLSQVLS